MQLQEKLMPKRTIYIGQDICWKLPEKEQKKWKSVERYKPDAIMEQMEEFEEMGRDWRDPFGPFTDLEDYEDFWGDDFSQTGGWVYKKNFKDFSEEDKKYFEELSKKVKEEGYGNQLRILSK